MNEDAEPFDEDESSPTAFVSVPAIFWANLSPEQFVAQQQIYRVAYEKARQKATGGLSSEDFRFDI